MIALRMARIAVELVAFTIFWMLVMIAISIAMAKWHEWSTGLPMNFGAAPDMVYILPIIGLIGAVDSVVRFEGWLQRRRM